MAEQMERMKELVELLNRAGRAYYQEDREIMSNLEYDTLYDELQVLEEKTGVTLAGSPTTKVGYEAMDELPKEADDHHLGGNAHRCSDHDAEYLPIDDADRACDPADFNGTHRTRDKEITEILPCPAGILRPHQRSG